jgi:hypothetical protein
MFYRQRLQDFHRLEEQKREATETELHEPPQGN